MKTNVTFKPFDVVKLNSTSAILIAHPNSKDFYGIVREIGTNFSLIEWYNKKNSTSTVEASVSSAWIPNGDIEFVGSLYHLISAGLAPAATTSTATTMATEVAKPKRKYTRKEGSAKPGPKPKKEKAAKVKAEKPKKMTKAEKAAAALAAEGPEIVEFPTDANGNKPTEFRFSSGNYGMATGKFKYFATREDIKRSVRESGCTYYNKVDSSLDFIIIGEKPGPAKIQRLDSYYRRKIRINEKQWLALLGSSKFKFSDEDEARVVRRNKLAC